MFSWRHKFRSLISRPCENPDNFKSYEIRVRQTLKFPTRHKFCARHILHAFGVYDNISGCAAPAPGELINGPQERRISLRRRLSIRVPECTARGA
jgi:hypothetical protein